MENTEQNPEQITEVHLNLRGRILFSAISAWLLGKQPNLKIKGTRLQIETLARTMQALREFHEELQKPDTDIQTVKQKLGTKNSRIKEFESVFGMKWPSQL